MSDQVAGGPASFSASAAATEAGAPRWSSDLQPSKGGYRRRSMSVIPKGGNHEVVFHDGSTIPAEQTSCALSIRPGGGYLGALAIHPPEGGVLDTAQIQRGLNRGPLSLRIPVPPKWDESALLECSVLSQFVDARGGVLLFEAEV